MDWREELKRNITQANELNELLNLNIDNMEQLQKILKHFPMTITQYYYSLIDRENPHDDPICKMSIPSIRETDLSGDFDTSGEADNTVISGMQHKYNETVLILSTHRCAMYCRHCFRKRLVGISEDETTGNIEEMAAYVKAHPEVNNVLISGGDAFLNTNEDIRRYLEVFSSMEQLDLIRFGTRTPVTLPMRIYEDPELMEILTYYNKRKQIYVITQVNHPKELTEEAKRSVSMLLEAGIIVKNQTVLLKGVNDNSDVMAELLRKQTACGLIPYYIFQCRPVAGVRNQFQVPLKQGYDIIQQAKYQQNGQGKAIRYVMSHVSGKLEILGLLEDDKMLFKFHQAKSPDDRGRMFTKQLTDGQTWLDDLD